jgi:hypothetical protein
MEKNSQVQNFPPPKIGKNFDEFRVAAAAGIGPDLNDPVEDGLEEGGGLAGASLGARHEVEGGVQEQGAGSSGQGAMISL